MPYLVLAGPSYLAKSEREVKERRGEEEEKKAHS